MGKKACCVINCYNTTASTSVHEVPSNHSLRIIWHKHLENFIKPTCHALNAGQNYYVCGDHFEKECFRLDTKTRILKKDAYPTKFQRKEEQEEQEVIIIKVEESEEELRQNEELPEMYKKLSEEYEKVVFELTQCQLQLRKRSIVDTIAKDAKNGDQSAIFLLKQIQNYKKRKLSDLKKRRKPFKK